MKKRAAALHRAFPLIALAVVLRLHTYFIIDLYQIDSPVIAVKPLSSGTVLRGHPVLSDRLSKSRIFPP